MTKGMLAMKNRSAILCVVGVLLAGSTLADEAAPSQAVEAEAQPAAAEMIIRVIDKQADVERINKAEPADANEKDAVKKEADGASAKPAVDEPAEEELTEAELRQKMRDLEQQLRDTRTQFQQKANEQREKVKKNAQPNLNDIVLPENPSRDQCKEYVSKLRKACEGRRSFSSNDPATIKLKALPTQHADLLIAEISNRTSLRIYANYAMRDIDPEDLRERFVQTLDENPNNIGIIVMHGWVEDVRPAVVEHINNADGTVMPSWFQAAVELDDPTLYPKLHEITTQSRYAIQFINMLEMLPDYDLAHTVDVCWQRARDGKLAISQTSFAGKAAAFGNVDALGSLISQLRHSTSYMSHSSSYNARRTNILRYIDYRGSNKDIQKWYADNKEELVFDHRRQRFILPEPF